MGKTVLTGPVAPAFVGVVPASPSVPHHHADNLLRPSHTSAIANAVSVWLPLQQCCLLLLQFQTTILQNRLRVAVLLHAQTSSLLTPIAIIRHTLSMACSPCLIARPPTTCLTLLSRPM